MRKLKKILAVFLLLALSSCIPSPSDTTKLEGGAGQGAGGSSCKSLGEMLKIPPDEPLKRDLPYEGGGANYVGPVEYILTFVDQKFTSAVQDIFNELNQNNAMDILIRYSFALWIAIFGISLLLGLVKTGMYDLTTTIVKVMVILVLATDYSFYSFFVKDTIEDSGDVLINIMAGAFSGGVSDIMFIDDVVSTLLSFNVFKLIYTLLFSPETWAAWIYGVILTFFLYYFVTSLLKAVYLIVIAMLVRGFMFALGPIFLAATLFRQTRSLFDGWLKQIINFTLMPIIVFTFLGFFYAILQFYIQELSATPMGQTPKPVCYDKAYTMPGNTNTWYKPKLGVPGDQVYGVDAQIPINLTPILALLIITYTLRQMLDWAVSLSSQMTQALTTFSTSMVPTQLRKQLGDINRGRNRAAPGVTGGGGGSVPRSGATRK